ncbi:MAG: tRNA (adenosine(37)-N6)-threonylcarbamoyltransferase complex ATPase subunit type 1 TsaE [Gammaproteobacteria bacterium]|nr:tRNA (adenosine(37)-N6)-threonylcarbamoyltransferase complex ATPase subunit type 1 TsaE [Gammaproteobacteria bacterium]NNJ91803.1 tRNA (adenosine(37)-N6)-threonylcarbamoyltransferase complex ATPase subunit type 1 TsaE [Gammaproteobacteria bacterium]
MTSVECSLESGQDQEAYGEYLAGYCNKGLVIYLQGPLGAGKTTLTRGFLRGLGYSGKVKSPTYTLVEEYSLPQRNCVHFDLYRLADPEELEFMGIRDFTLEQDILLVEWPDKGTGFLPEADLLINISYAETGRTVQILSNTEKGNIYLKQLPL